MGLRMRLLVFGLCPFDISSTGRATCRARIRADLLGRVSSSSMRAALSIWPASQFQKRISSVLFGYTH
uniref:Uncharacterized protein n=1 Tax=Rhizophora mucronata TaxID=61149 RepID=A0A2P2KFC7_RHIMU